MDYREARAYLKECEKYGSVLGLANMEALLSCLGNPHRDLKFIHIAGTNGKGSTLAYISTILKESGCRVGRYISPTLFTYRERIQINGEVISKEALARWVTVIKKAIDQLLAQGGVHPTVFEIETVLGFLYFREEGCECIVLETGLGGREDATNVVDTTVMEIITPVSMDHMSFLGDSLARIAAEKAGIIKTGTTVISARQKPQAGQVIEETCKRKKARLYIAQTPKQVSYGWREQCFDYKHLKALTIHLAGIYQIENAAVAVEAALRLRELGFHISDEQIRAGLLKTGWQGRFTVLDEKPIFIIDGAHNQDGARVLRESLEYYFTNHRIFYIMGVFKDKEYQKMVEELAPLGKRIFTIQTPDNPRALEAEVLAKAVAKVNPEVEAARSIEEAMKKAMEVADENDIIVACGSLSFLGEIQRRLLNEEQTDDRSGENKTGS